MRRDRRRARGCRGQTAVEYAGVILLAVAIIAALLAADLGASIGNPLDAAVGSLPDMGDSDGEESDGVDGPESEGTTGGAETARGPDEPPIVTAQSPSTTSTAGQTPLFNESPLCDLSPTWPGCAPLINPCAPPYLAGYPPPAPCAPVDVEFEPGAEDPDVPMCSVTTSSYDHLGENADGSPPLVPCPQDEEDPLPTDEEVIEAFVEQGTIDIPDSVEDMVVEHGYCQIAREEGVPCTSFIDQLNELAEAMDTGLVGDAAELIVGDWFECAYSISEGSGPVNSHCAWSALDVVPVGRMTKAFDAYVLARRAGANGDEAAETAARVIDSDPVDLTTPQRRNHILHGDQTGGGHLWPGQPGKTPFPQDWDGDRIIHEISDIATDPDASRVVQPNGRTAVTGTRDGVEIVVIVDEARDEIITGYPTSRPPNPP